MAGGVDRSGANAGPSLRPARGKAGPQTGGESQSSNAKGVAPEFRDRRDASDDFGDRRTDRF
ncbi:MAG: hypothetical protein JWR21_2261 [Herminiimonas sp.]|nr:hypothetical protein [Herminiimonas sp.]